MRRVLLTWRDHKIYSYPAMLYLGLLAGLVAGNLASHRIGIDAAAVFVAQLILIPFALIGARLMHVPFHWRHYRQAPGGILAAQRGGADMLGGLPVALLLSVPLLGALELSFSRFWDVTVFTIFTGMFITRFGCLLNGCCGGRVTDGFLGLELPGIDDVVRRRIPMQLLEAGWTLTVLGLAIVFQRHLGAPGLLFCLSIATYSLGRIALDPGREERYPWRGSLTVHQGLYGTTLMLCLLGAWLLERYP